jgi:hypothetical protein
MGQAFGEEYAGFGMSVEAGAEGLPVEDWGG